MKAPVVFWFRRDLRLFDNQGLCAAQNTGHPIIPLFIFDRQILDRLASRDDSRVTFIHQRLGEMRKELQGLGGDLWVAFGAPVEVLSTLVFQMKPMAIYSNGDFEPAATARDKAVAALCQAKQIPFSRHLDHLILPPLVGLKDNGGPYTVYTPYARKFLTQLDPGQIRPLKKIINPSPFFPGRAPKPWQFPTLEALGFKASGISAPPLSLDATRAANYGNTRNFVAQNQGTTGWGVHLRFGTLSVRQAFTFAMKHSPVLTGELIWREFFAQIMAHYPAITREPFRAFGKAFPLRDSPKDYKAWCEGRTGYPLVDAGMRELLATGTMHNRVRMVCASFLAKHLLLDYRLGEAHFARHLLDFELPSNNGNWQWAAGTGTDAAPYFRIFNPAAQALKFDPGGHYVRKWVPEVGTPSYPPPMVDHQLARQRALAAYGVARTRSATG